MGINRHSPTCLSFSCTSPWFRSISTFVHTCDWTVRHADRLRGRRPDYEDIDAVGQRSYNNHTGGDVFDQACNISTRTTEGCCPSVFSSRPANYLPLPPPPAAIDTGEAFLAGIPAHFVLFTTSKPTVALTPTATSKLLVDHSKIITTAAGGPTHPHNKVV